MKCTALVRPAITKGPGEYAISQEAKTALCPYNRPMSRSLLDKFSCQILTLLLAQGLLGACSLKVGLANHSSPNPKECNMSEESHIHHGINYIEFAATDLEASKAFYRSAFGWEFNDYGPEYAAFARRAVKRVACAWTPPRPREVRW